MTISNASSQETNIDNNVFTPPLCQLIQRVKRGIGIGMYLAFTSIEISRSKKQKMSVNTSQRLITRDDDAVRARTKKTVEHTGAGIRWFFLGGHVSEVGL